jgi:hypothetical protein
MSGQLAKPPHQPADAPLTQAPATAVQPHPRLWLWASATAAAALFFPKIEGIRNHGRSPWQLLYFFVPLDLEGLILGPLLIVITFALFWLIGGWALRNANQHNRPARVGLACGITGIAGIILFWLSIPIILGGLAITLGLQARHLQAIEGRGGEAIAALITGTAAIAVGAIMWSFIT